MNKVVVVTRTKDRSVFLKRAIESVKGQTFTDYTHVIINDGGDKNAVGEVVSSFNEAIQGKIELFHRSESSNAPDTILNESIDRIDSEYFAIHDDDDTWHSQFLERTVEYLDEQKDAAAVVVRTDKVVESLQGGLIKEKKRSQWMPNVRVVNLYRQCIDNQLTPIATLFRRDAYVQVGKFDDSLPVVGDWEFGVRLLSKYDAGFINPGYALANYHHRPKIGSSQDAISSDDKHRHYTNKVMNKYLREELANGELGVGYIMSKIKYEQSFLSQVAKRLMPEFMAKKLKRRAQD